MKIWPHRRGTRAAIGAAFIGAVLAGFLAMTSTAQARPPGFVVKEYPNVTGTFTGGDTDFTVIYDVVVIMGDDGKIYAVFEQRDSSDSPFGTINSDGVPPVLRNPGKEKFTGGRMKNARTMTYDHYEYISNGSTRTWTNVVFNFPAGSLPFPAPEAPTPAPTPEPEEEEVDTGTAVSQPAAKDEGSFPTGVVVAIAAGVAVAAGATRLVTQTRSKGKRTCEEEYAAWQAAEAAYNQAVAAWTEARDAVTDTRNALQRAQLEKTTAFTEASNQHMSETGGLEAMGDWGEAGFDAAIGQAEAAYQGAEAAFEAAKERLKELDAQREAARKAYEECMGQAAAASGSTTGNGATATAGGTSVATAPPPSYGPTQERGCKPGTTRNRKSKKSSVNVVIDFRVWTATTGTRFERAQDADELAVSLKEIAEIIGDLEEGKLPGKAGELQDLKDQAKDLADKAGTIAEEGVGEFLKGEISDAVQEQVDAVNEAAKDAVNEASGGAVEGVGDALDAMQKVPDLLKEPHKIPLEILKFTAELGAEVVLFAGRVVNANDMYTIYASIQTLQIDILWTTWEVCVNNRWKKTGEVVTANGPTKWSEPRSFGEFPGSAYGHHLEGEMKRVLGWCQLQLNNSNEKLSAAINNPPSTR